MISGDYSTLGLLIADNNTVKTKLDTLTSQVGTGYVATSYGGLGTAAESALNLQAQVNALNTEQTAAGVVAAQQNVTQTALGQIASIASSFAASSTSLNGVDPAAIDSVAGDGQDGAAAIGGIAGFDRWRHLFVCRHGYGQSARAGPGQHHEHRPLHPDQHGGQLVVEHDGQLGQHHCRHAGGGHVRRARHDSVQHRAGAWDGERGDGEDRVVRRPGGPAGQCQHPGDIDRHGDHRVLHARPAAQPVDARVVVEHAGQRSGIWRAGEQRAQRIAKARWRRWRRRPGRWAISRATSRRRRRRRATRARRCRRSSLRCRMSTRRRRCRTCPRFRRSCRRRIN